jgi:hypothetical protein
MPLCCRSVAGDADDDLPPRVQTAATVRVGDARQVVVDGLLQLRRVVDVGDRPGRMGAMLDLR